MRIKKIYNVHRLQEGDESVHFAVLRLDDNKAEYEIDINLYREKEVSQLLDKITYCNDDNAYVSYLTTNLKYIKSKKFEEKFLKAFYKSIKEIYDIKLNYVKELKDFMNQEPYFKKINLEKKLKKVKLIK